MAIFRRQNFPQLLLSLSTLSILFIWLLSRNTWIPSIGIYQSQLHAIKNENTTNAKNLGYFPQPVIYGHVHMGKTAGTSLNGELATHFERICGHKGYSYDAFQTNMKHTNLSLKFHRGRVHWNQMDEIGYEDCDWISNEIKAKFWMKHFRNWPQPLELHVPCRQPIDHLMSKCNFHGISFNCTQIAGHQYTQQIQQTKTCLTEMNRYNKNLETAFNVKCYDFKATFTNYTQYMAERLQKKRIETEYIHRPTNRERRRDSECIWNRTDLKRKIVEYMVKNYDYYAFCDRCIGSQNDLFA